MRKNRESGIALITTMIILLLLAALLAGFTMLVNTDVRLGAVDRDRTRAEYAAHAGMEKITADLGDLFSINVAPTAAQINALTATPAPTPGQPGWPVLPGINFVDDNLGGAPGTGYNIAFTPDPATGNPQATNRTILSGPFQGFIGLITPYTITVTARTSIAAATQTGSEVRLRRSINTVGIPVFQFGIFSQTDLSFFNGPVFNFGGRVHTNGNLWLATGSTTTFADRVTSVGEVIRTNLSNGWPTSNGYTGNISIIKAPGVYRNLASNEGSLVGTLGTALNEPTWTNLSIGTYNGNLRNGRTGAKMLNLPLVTFGAQPIDLIRRPLVNEDVNNPLVYAQRYFTSNLGDQLTSLRILLSDTPAQITSLPSVTAVAPVWLGNLGVTPIAGYTVGANASTGGAGGILPPMALSPGAANGYTTPANAPLLDGYLKIEMQDAGMVWHDVTVEILNLGIAGRKISDGANKNRNALPGTVCAQPNPDAVIRIERLRDDPSTTNCGNGSTVATDYWPNVLFDTREGTLRDTAVAAPASAPANPPNFAPLMLGGVMHYIELDMNNLRRWFAGQIGLTGNQARNINGYVVYFSDRRTNVNAAGNDTGEYGFEDFVNRSSATGTPDGVLDPLGGEDLNANGTLETYGQVPVIPAGSIAPLASGALRPWSTVGGFGANNNTNNIHPLRVNKPLFFRRALMLVNGTLGNLPPGITIASENPLYIKGDFNASTGAGFGNPHVAASVIADTITFLSNSWNDLESFRDPYAVNNRNATTTFYRLAIVSGKGISFQQPTVGAPPQDFGTDGGVHNFLRYLEDWSGQTLNYRGSIVSFYYNRQAVGTYKCCNTVYSPPTRGYNFDIDFLTPGLLPPRTPMFRDVNTTGFTQLIMPWQ
jgi:hypothetical protein